jgi:branched-chain amino acid transport system substrate-binding protein
MVNASGGINGRKIEVISADTGSTPTGAETAEQSLLDRGVFALLVESAVAPGPYYPTLHADDIPIVGAGCSDGPEWSNPKLGWNIFSYMGCDGTYPASTTLGLFLKQHGVTKFGIVAPGDYPGAKAWALNTAASAVAAGIKLSYENFSSTLGQVDFSTEALAMKTDGVNGVAMGSEPASDYGLSEDLANIGFKPVQLYAGVGYAPEAIDDPATNAALQNDYSTTSFQPFETGTPAVKAFAAELKKWAGVTSNPPIPPGAVEGGWFISDMFAAILQTEGRNVTRSGFISAGHHLSGFNAQGIFASKLNLATDWGEGTNDQDLNDCTYIVQIVGKKFLVENNNKPYCGEPLAGSEIFPSNPAPPLRK